MQQKVQEVYSTEVVKVVIEVKVDVVEVNVITEVVEIKIAQVVGGIEVQTQYSKKQAQWW